jgi:hypothetical protein
MNSTCAPMLRALSSAIAITVGRSGFGQAFSRLRTSTLSRAGSLCASVAAPSSARRTTGPPVIGLPRNSLESLARASITAVISVVFPHLAPPPAS